MDKPRGMVTMRGETRNQRADVVVEADGKMLVASRPAQ
jgi:acyl dehydratase